MNYVKSLFSQLRVGDVVSIIFFTFLTILNVLFCTRLGDWWLWSIINTLATLFILFIANYPETRVGAIKVVRDWYWYAFILIVFKEMYAVLPAINPVDQDAVLIQVDRWLFGVNPTQWLYRFANPLLTEYLQLSYFIYYLFPFTICFWLYRRKMYDEFYYAFFLVMYGFYLSYIGYLLVPAIGPRFTLHDFHAIDKELPGVFLTDVFRSIINTGESIAPSVANPSAFAQRDCFPSGHAEITLIVMYLSCRYKSKTAYFLFPAGISLIIATVYLRYHYVIDLIAGAAFMVVTIWSAPCIQRWWMNKVESWKAS
jgi:membrane-associated phospholipid phosphatase